MGANLTIYRPTSYLRLRVTEVRAVCSPVNLESTPGSSALELEAVVSRPRAFRRGERGN